MTGSSAPTELPPRHARTPSRTTTSRPRLWNTMCWKDKVAAHLRADRTQMESVYQSKFGSGTALDWVVQCVSAYASRKAQYEKACTAFVRCLMAGQQPKKGIHSFSHRVKDPLHLADKLRRKCLAKEPEIVQLSDLFGEGGVTDLGGVRILHLYKDDWEQIHGLVTAAAREHEFDYIKTVKQSRNLPRVAYIRHGEDSTPYEEAQLKVRNKESRYTSLHYTLEWKPCGVAVSPPVIIEVQVRTVFEEGWGEIDHQRRYPAGASDIVTTQLALLNDAANVADRVARTFKRLDELPDFVSHTTTSHLVRAATHVLIYSPTLNWAAHNSKIFARDFFNGSARSYTYYVPSFWDNRQEKKVEENRRKICCELKKQGPIAKIKWRRLQNPAVVPPVFHDLLLLKNTYYAEKQQTLGIRGMTNGSAKGADERQDVLVYNQMELKILRQFFQQCEKGARVWGY